MNQAQKKALRFYPGAPTCNEAIEKLTLAQDLLIDVGLLIGVNWNNVLADSLFVQADDLGSITIKVKKMRKKIMRWSK